MFVAVIVTYACYVNSLY